MSLDSFFADLPFRPDAFQVEAAQSVAAGRSVVVTAPTGAGKTLVAEAAVHVAMQQGTRAFYTTPLKALSNQKFGDFRVAYGPDRVGLLTGDNSINGDAPVVVMTTEVLRNMIYAGSGDLRNLGVVVLDEVHYLQDRFRGMVWEEIIIHLEAGIPIVALSATVSNAEEFAGWIRARRGPTDLVIERHRPVPLESLYMVKDRSRREPLVVAPVFGAKETKPNPLLARLFRKSGSGRGNRFATPRRYELAEYLDAEGLLPAIYFIFSRRGCDAAVEQVAGSGVRLTTPDEAAAIRAYARERTSHISDTDLAVLGFGRWLSWLEAGIAAHHAGKIPAFKEAVEGLFAAGLVKLVFATETLSLGINMPARTVVLENLSKFTGESHELLQPGDYTQLTGRAGRRGIDTRGTAVVLYSRWVPFERVAAVAGAGSHPLESSFRPNYNMAVNLIANYDRAEATRLLTASFGQFRAEARAEQLEADIAALEADLAVLRGNAECERGDVWEYLRGSGGSAASSHGTVMRSFARELGPGDVLEEERDGGWHRAVMLARGLGSNPRLLLLGSDGRLRRIAPGDLDASTVRIGTLVLPEPFRPRETRYQRSVLRELRSFEPTGDPVPAYGGDTVVDHGVGGCPDLDDHRRWARRVHRGERRLERLRSRRAGLGNDLVARFDGIVGLLTEWGYVADWSLTAKGEHLRFVYNELDLLVAEAIETGLLDGLDPAALAALASVFVYEPRLGAEEGGWPTSLLAERAKAVWELAEQLAADEGRLHVAETRPPEFGFVEAAYYWAAGIELEDVIGDDEGRAGDFVRTCRQIIDLVRQIRDGYPALRSVAAAAADAVDRGVVAAGGIE